jgi:hypothetical protein
MVANLAEAKSHPISEADFLKADIAMREAKREQEDASASLARAKKDAKAKAVHMLAYKWIENLRKLDDDEQPIVVRTFVAYAGWLGMKIGEQASLIDAPKTAGKKTKASPADEAARTGHSVWAAGEAGLEAGRDGDPQSINPHPPGSEQHVAWHTKWNEGLAERATAARMLDTEVERVADTADATRKAGRGRGRSVAARSAASLENANGGARAH